MNKKGIKLGYKVNEGTEVKVFPSHLIVTGITQLSGKTTTLEALIKRSGFKAIVFKTKIGEKSFSDGEIITPFFRDRSDYEFVKSLIEAYAKEKIFLEKGTLMQLCKGSSSLVEIKKKVDEKLADGKLRGLKEEIHIRLQHYLENLIPQIQYANFSKVLTVYDGINIMNLERFSEEAQSLIIQSVADEVLKTMKDTIIVIPEAWKFLPQKHNNPCKRMVESFIRQGATNNNFIWIDSQDMAGVDKTPLKQISTWILGYQAERNEVKHTIDQIALPVKMKPSVDEIMNLKKGHFFLSSYNEMCKVYVQPIWMEDKEAKEIAKGKKDIDTVEAPEKLVGATIRPIIKEKESTIRFDDSQVKKQVVELRLDFFNKIEELNTAIQKAFSELYVIKGEIPKIDNDEIVSMVLQKMPSGNGNLNKEEIISEVLAKIPRASGTTVYEVAPLEKIKKDFLEETKNNLLLSIGGLDDQQKKMLKWIEQNEKNTKKTEIFLNCFGKSATSGSVYTNLGKKILEMKNLELIRVDTAQRVFPFLKDRIKSRIEQYDCNDSDIQQVYDHIIMEILDK